MLGAWLMCMSFDTVKSKIQRRFFTDDSQVGDCLLAVNAWRKQLQNGQTLLILVHFMFHRFNEPKKLQHQYHNGTRLRLRLIRN
jgi:hypothetical protein